MEIPKTLWLKHNMKSELFKRCQFFDLPDFLTYRATGFNRRSCCSVACKCSYVPVKGGWQPEFFKKIGLEVKIPPQATFYIWLDLTNLPPPLNNGLTFFEELLKEKTIVIPGIFFDINPAHRRNLFKSPCHEFVRISFGPPIEDLDMGLDAMARVLEKAKKQGMSGFGEGDKQVCVFDDCLG